MNRARVILFVAIAMLMCSAVALGGCSRAASEITNEAIDTTEQARDDARTQACYANERMVEAGAKAYEAETGELPDNIPTLVPDYAPQDPDCPSGGVYSLAIEGGQPVCTCSVHGHYSASAQ